MARLGKVALALLGTIGLLASVAGLGFFLGGVSAQIEPSVLEARVARFLRHWMIPASDRRRDNPLVLSAEVLESAMGHWADHCASCHGNDGRGETAIGRGLYPRAPDMTSSSTQEMPDGELYWIIENGIKLTGMPAWGDSQEESSESWELVHFIRHLPSLSAKELDAMKRLNPVSREALEEEMEIERFLAGAGPPPAESDSADHRH